MMIYPGETASCEFKVPFEADDITKGKLTFWQDGKPVLSIDITTSNVSTVSNETYVTVELTQAQSLKLQNSVTCAAQLNLLLNGTARVTSELMPIRVGLQSYRLPVM